jgi:hypothetical protein
VGYGFFEILFLLVGKISNSCGVTSITCCTGSLGCVLIIVWGDTVVWIICWYDFLQIIFGSTVSYYFSDNLVSRDDVAFCY